MALVFAILECCCLDSFDIGSRNCTQMPGNSTTGKITHHQNRAYPLRIGRYWPTSPLVPSHHRRRPSVAAGALPSSSPISAYTLQPCASGPSPSSSWPATLLLPRDWRVVTPSSFSQPVYRAVAREKESHTITGMVAHRARPS